MRRAARLGLLPLLTLAALLPLCAEASVPSASNALAPDRVERLIASNLSAAFDVATLEPLNDAPRFALGEVSLLAAPRSERFHLAGAELLSEEPRRGPPLSYPETRVRGFDFLGQEVVGVFTGVSLELHWGYGEFGLGKAEGNGVNLYAFVSNRPHEKTDPLGLAQLDIPGAGESAEHKRKAKESWRELKWLLQAPGKILTDSNYRGDALSALGGMIYHGVQSAATAPGTELFGVGVLKAPGAIAKAPKLAKIAEEVIEGVSGGERALPKTVAAIEGLGPKGSLLVDGAAAELPVVEKSAPRWKLYEMKHGGEQTPMTTTFEGKTVGVRLDKPPSVSEIVDFKDYEWSKRSYSELFIQERVKEDFTMQIRKYKTIRSNVHLQFSADPPEWVVDTISKEGATYSVAP